jgi:tight adherence protein B
MDAGMMVFAMYVLGAGAAGGLVWMLWSVGAGSAAEFQSSYIGETKASLGDVYSTFPAEKVFQLSAAIAAVVFLLITAAINWIAGILFGGAAFFAPRMVFNILRDKRRAVFNEQLVDGLELLANSVRAGLTLPQAIELLVREMKPPITQEFGRVLQEYRLGTDFDDAMLNMARRMGSRDLDVLVNAVAITRRSGGNVGEMFQSIAASIRERFRLEGKVRAMAATANMQAFVMSSMPFGLMVALFFIDPPHVQLLFQTTLGLFCVGAVVALVVAAFLWIRSIMDLDI